MLSQQVNANVISSQSNIKQPEKQKKGRKKPQKPKKTYSAINRIILIHPKYFEIELLLSNIKDKNRPMKKQINQTNKENNQQINETQLNKNIQKISINNVLLQLQKNLLIPQKDEQILNQLNYAFYDKKKYQEWCKKYKSEIKQTYPTTVDNPEDKQNEKQKNKIKTQTVNDLTQQLQFQTNKAYFIVYDKENKLQHIEQIEKYYLYFGLQNKAKKKVDKFKLLKQKFNETMLKDLKYNYENSIDSLLQRFQNLKTFSGTDKLSISKEVEYLYYQQNDQNEQQRMRKERERLQKERLQRQKLEKQQRQYLEELQRKNKLEIQRLQRQKKQLLEMMQDNKSPQDDKQIYTVPVQVKQLSANKPGYRWKEKTIKQKSVINKNEINSPQLNIDLLNKAQKDEKILIQYKLNDKIIGKQRVRARTIIKDPLMKAYNVYMISPRTQKKQFRYLANKQYQYSYCKYPFCSVNQYHAKAKTFTSRQLSNQKKSPRTIPNGKFSLQNLKKLRLDHMQKQKLSNRYTHDESQVVKIFSGAFNSTIQSKSRLINSNKKQQYKEKEVVMDSTLAKEKIVSAVQQEIFSQIVKINYKTKEKLKDIFHQNFFQENFRQKKRAKFSNSGTYDQYFFKPEYKYKKSTSPGKKSKSLKRHSIIERRYHNQEYHNLIKEQKGEYMIKNFKN